LVSNFHPGNPGGSLEATRRSFNRDFLLALAADFKKHGAAAIEKVREQQPAAYMKICALLVPREMKLEHAGGVKAMTEDQIVDAIAAIEGFLARRSGEVVLQGPRVVAVVGQLEPTGMAQHVRVDREWHLGGLPEALDESMETDGTDGPAALGNEYVGVSRVIAA